MAKVIHSDNMGSPFMDRLETELKKRFQGCKRIAVKLHFGEPGNDKSLVPEDVKPLTDELSKLGIDFFLFDSSVKYPSVRNNPETHKKAALEKGWGELGPVELSDEYIEVPKENLTHRVCKKLADADGVLVVTHFTGHGCAGFGGAIKNLGMGALTKESKGMIHDGGHPEYVGGCIQCKACEKACSFRTKRVKVTDKPVFTDCLACSKCISACPVGALKPRINYFDVLLAEGATAAQETFKNVYYVTLMIKINRTCDCMSKPKEDVCPDLGVLASTDAVAIDMAAYDLVKKSAGKDVFLEIHNKSGTEQVKAAEGFGMGTSKYEVTEV